MVKSTHQKYSSAQKNLWKRQRLPPSLVFSLKAWHFMVCKKLKRAAKNRTGFLKKTIVYINFFSFNVGVGCVTNVTLFRTASADVRLFMHAADWLVGQQDPTSGGWPVQVTFNEKKAKYTKYARAKEIPAGWNSAMAQLESTSQTD